MTRTTYGRERSSHSSLADAIRFIAEHRLVYGVLGLFCIGIFIGSLTVKYADTGVMAELDQMFAGFISLRARQLFLPAFLSSFSVNFLVLLVTFLLGFCAIAPPLILLFSVARGFSVGITISYLYSGAGGTGFIYAVQNLVPAALISSFAMVLACASSYRLSGMYYSLFSHGLTDAAVNEAVRAYLTRYAVYIIIVFLSALTDGICCMFFGLSGLQ